MSGKGLQRAESKPSNLKWWVGRAPPLAMADGAGSAPRRPMFTVDALKRRFEQPSEPAAPVAAVQLRAKKVGSVTEKK